MVERSDATETAQGPVFVYGALRSGTTLLRIMLKSHPALQSPGEADFLFDHLIADPAQPSGWRIDAEALGRNRIFVAKEIPLPRATDGSEAQAEMIAAMAEKEEGRIFFSLHRHARRLAEMFPAAPVIHLLRDPRDVALSSIGMGWTGTGYHGVGHWIASEADWDAAGIDPARVCETSFERLMAETESELTRLCAFLGLSFDPAMRTYWEGSTYGPPEPAAAARWRGRADPHEIALIEGRLGPLLQARGYEPAGAPATPGQAERAALALRNLRGRWAFAIDRYGAPLFFARKTARFLGLSGLERRFDKRQEAIRIRNLQ